MNECRPKILLCTSVIFKKVPKVNNHPRGENSTNQVTLVAIQNMQRSAHKTFVTLQIKKD
jgi:hypothetical protein